MCFLVFVLDSFPLKTDAGLRACTHVSLTFPLQTASKDFQRRENVIHFDPRSAATSIILCASTVHLSAYRMKSSAGTRQILRSVTVAFLVAAMIGKKTDALSVGPHFIGFDLGYEMACTLNHDICEDFLMLILSFLVEHLVPEFQLLNVRRILKVIPLCIKKFIPRPFPGMVPMTMK